LSENLSFSATC